MNEKKNLALLCDYGMDDAIGTLYLFEHAHQFNKIDIVAIGGNFPLKQTLINAKRIITHYNGKLDNVTVVDTSSIAQPEEILADIHGEDGMGDLLPQDYNEDITVLDYDEWLEGIDDNYVIVSLGPCTVTIDILEKKGSLPLIMMAGNINEPPNYKGYEFNHGMDIQAFAKCVKYPHAAATLDTCHCPACNLNLHELPKEGMFAKMLARYRDMSRGRGEEICSVYDLTALVYLTHPQRFESAVMEDKDGNPVNVLKYISQIPVFL